MAIDFTTETVITIIEPKTGTDQVLAKKINDVWLCSLCPATYQYKTRMLDHIRYDHIEVKKRKINESL